MLVDKIKALAYKVAVVEVADDALPAEVAAARRNWQLPKFCHNILRGYLLLHLLGLILVFQYAYMIESFH